MKRLASMLLGLAVAAAACQDPYLPPQIETFTVDNPNPPAGQEVHLTFVVRDAAIISIVPEPGEVTASPVTVQPKGPTTYTLRAGNLTGFVSKDLVVTVQTTSAATVPVFSVVPSQAPAGTPRTLTWNVKNSVNSVLSGGTLGEPFRIHAKGTFADAPRVTTVYTISAQSGTGYTPAQVTATAVARVVEPSAISSFQATPATIAQGDSTALSWDGTALSWMLTQGDVDMPMGNRQRLVVQPSATATYALSGTGPGGPVGPRTVTVTVTPRPGQSLSYAAPAVTTQKLKLVADACAAPCSALTLRLLAAAPVSLRGVAIDLPLDAAKVSLDAASFASALDAGKAVLGSGPLRNTLVLGAARKGTGSGPAADFSFAAADEVAHFSLVLQSAGGKGVVFDGASSSFAAFIQSASGRNPGGIAVGRLEAQ